MTIQNSESIFCNYCKTSLICDVERGEYVCPSCGFVENDRIVDNGPEWKAIDSEDKMNDEAMMGDLNLTHISDEDDANSENTIDKELAELNKYA